MELQAIRYASMISAMTFERAVQIHGEFLTRIGEPGEGARARMLAFLTGKNLMKRTSPPMYGSFWCLRILGRNSPPPYCGFVIGISTSGVFGFAISGCEAGLVDVQQIIPLPEAHEYQVQLREKEQVGRKKRAERYDVRLKFWEGLVALARAPRARHANISRVSITGWGRARAFAASDSTMSSYRNMESRNSTSIGARLRKISVSSINFMVGKRRSKRSSTARFRGNASTQRGPAESST